MAMAERPYRVRYSTSTIIEGNWAAATLATGEPAPQVASSAETFTVTGLTNGVTYIFAVTALRQPVYYFSVTALDNTQNRNESDFSPESTLAIGPFTEGAESNQLSASPAVTVPYCLNPFRTVLSR